MNNIIDTIELFPKINAELIKLLKEEVGFAERGYTKRNDV